MQPTSAHRAYTTAAQRRQAPPPAPPAQQQNTYRPPPIQPSQQPPAVSPLVDSTRKRSLLDDDDDLLENLPDELFNLQPAAVAATRTAAVYSVGPAAAVRRPMPVNMPAQPLPAASGNTGQLTPTKRKADDSVMDTSNEPHRQHMYAPPPQPRPPPPHFAQQSPPRQPQPDVQFNAHLNALVTAPPARPEAAAMMGVKMEGADGAMAVKQEGGEYVRMTKKERAQLVLSKTKAEKEAAEARANRAEAQKRAAEEREKRERAEAELALLRNNLNSIKQETARNAAQSSQHKMAQSQQAEQAKHTLEVNYQAVKMERDVLEMQLNERNAQLRRLQQQQQQQQQQPQLKSEVAAPLPVIPSPPSSQVPAVVKAQPAAMDTSEDSVVVAAAPPVSLARNASSASPPASGNSSASNEALIEAFRSLAPSLLGTDQTEGQRVASQLLTVPLDKDSAEASNGSSPLIALLHSLNSYIANQPAAPTHSASQPLASSSLPATFPSVTQHLSHYIKELESSTMQVRDGSLPPDALLSPTCHLLNSLCNISSVPVDLTLFAATQPSGLPRRMKAIDDNIVQLLNILLVMLRASPTCRRAAVRGLSSTGAAQATSAVIVPAVYQHPLYAFRPPKTNSLSRQLSDRAAGGSSGDSERDREANEQRLKERAEQQQKQRADTSPAASALPLNYPDPIPLLFNILQSYQRINPRSQADLFLQPALSCLLLLLDGVIAAKVSPTAVGFAGLLDERRLLPLLCWAQGTLQQVSLAVRCVAVQLFGLLVVDRDAVRLVAYRPQSTSPSLLQCLYSCLLCDTDRDKNLTDARQKEARSRQHMNHRLAARDGESGDKWLSVDKRQEVILSTRQHVVRFMAFVVERYGADGVQWLSNEREREERKESGEDETVVLDGDEHHILTMLVRLMTAEMQQIAAYQREYDPLHVLHSSQPSSAALFRDRRPDAIFPLTQPVHPMPHPKQPALSAAARSLLQTMRVGLVREAMQLTARLIEGSLPAVSQSTRRSPLLPSIVAQLVQCSHLLLTLLADIRASTIRDLQSMGEDAVKLKTLLLESRVLNASREEY